MNTLPDRLLRWTPRLLGLLFAGFLALFALDAHEGHHGFWPTLLAAVLHLIPVALVLAALAVAWRWPRPGALLFLGLAAAYTVFAWEHPSWILVIAGPPCLIGVLFLLQRRVPAQPRSAHPPGA